jgi:hypothetical protein
MEYVLVLQIRTDFDKTIAEEEIYWCDGLAEAEAIFNTLLAGEKP